MLEQSTGHKIKYLVLDSRGGGSGHWWLNQTQVDGLKQHTPYLIRVQAKNKAGMSEIVEEVFVKTRSEYT